MDYSSDFFNTLPIIIIILASVFIIIVTLLTCARKENAGVNLVLSSAVAEDNATSATIGCILSPPDEKFTYIRWYRTGVDEKPIGDVLAEIHYSDSNTQAIEEIRNKQKSSRRINPDSEKVIYVNEERTSESRDDEGAYANVYLSGIDEPVIVKSDESSSESSEEEDRVKTNTLRFLRGDTGLTCATTSWGGLPCATTSSDVRDHVYSTVDRRAKNNPPGYFHGGDSRKVKEGKYRAFMNNGYGGLIISDVTLEDAGNYTCYVFMTGIVKAKVSSQLSVVQKIVVSIDDVNAIENHDRNVNIVCKYTPKQEVVSDMNWYKITWEGTKLFLASSSRPCRSDRFEASHASGVGRLRIIDPVSGDEGYYECQVIRKNKCAAFYADGALTLPVRLFPFHRESSDTITSYRRPAIISFVQANRYHLLAFCEKRRRTATKETRSIATLRGVVRSRTIEWDKQQTTVYSKETDVIPLQRSPSNLKANYKATPNIAWPENPVPIVVNQKRGHIVLLFNTIASSERKHHRSPDWQLFSAHSKDGGKTWPIINQHFPWNNNKDSKCEVHSSRAPHHFELSSGHGIKLSTGTLLVNGLSSNWKYSSNDKKSQRHDSSVLTQIVLTGGKDGMDWRPIGKSEPESYSETRQSHMVAPEDIDEELDASLYHDNTNYRGVRNSNNFASHGCQAGLVSFKASVEDDNKHIPTWVLCSSPMKSDKKLSVRLSKDGCNTWSKESLILKDGRVGSSDLAYFERCHPASQVTIRMFGCLYESVSKKDGTERLTLVFNTFKLTSLLQEEQ